MAEDWDRLLQKRAELCTACAVPFEDDELVTTTLALGEEGFARVDHCEACAGSLPEDPWSLWRGQRTAASSARRGPMRFDLAYLVELYGRLERRGEDAAGLRWVVGLLLLRRRLLELRGRRFDEESDREVLLLAPKGEEDAHELADPRLDEAAIQAIADRLGEVFEDDRQRARARRGRPKGRPATDSGGEASGAA